MGWANDFAERQIKMIGLAEVLGALGLVLPLALNILPTLTLVAAVGLALLMGGAASTHIRRKESSIAPMVLGVLSIVVAAGRVLVA